MENLSKKPLSAFLKGFFDAFASFLYFLPNKKHFDRRYNFKNLYDDRNAMQSDLMNMKNDFEKISTYFGSPYKD